MFTPLDAKLPPRVLVVSVISFDRLFQMVERMRMQLRLVPVLQGLYWLFRCYKMASR